MNSPNPAYEIRAAEMQRRADNALGEFLLTVPESVRAKFLSRPDPSHDRARQVGLSRDVAESPMASYEPDVAAEVDSLPDELLEQFQFLRRMDAEVLAIYIERKIAAESDRYSLWLLKRVTARLIEAGNAKIVAVSIAFAISVPQVYVNGVLCKNQLQAAHVLGTTRQNLSKEVGRSKDWLGIECGLHVKPPEAVEAFSVAQSLNHWRTRLYGNN